MVREKARKRMETKREMVDDKLIITKDIGDCLTDGPVLKQYKLGPGVHIKGAVLWEEDLRELDLRGCGLQGASADFTDFTGSHLEGASFKKSSLGSAHFDEAYLFKADFTGADLRGASFKGADLREAKFRGSGMGRYGSGSYLGYTHFRESDLREVDLKRLDLREADFRGADLRGADLRGTKCYDIQLDGADLRGTKLEDITFAEFRKETVWGHITYDEFTKYDAGSSLDLHIKEIQKIYGSKGELYKDLFLTADFLKKEKPKHSFKYQKFYGTR